MKLAKLTKILFSGIVAFAFSTAANAQDKVSGTVTDENGEPVVGATVLVVGTMNGAQTDFEGKWSLLVSDPKNAVLQFACIGYETVEEALNDRAVVDVVMPESNLALEELVFVGYGTQKKVNLTGSVAAVNFSDITENRTIVNSSAALAGLVPGMMVRQTTGQPGSESTTIRIRGTGSFTSSASGPLVLVDGYEWSIDNINPNDIESISVLKDASSTAIYGSRAANGVILVTTKAGNVGKTQVSYSYNAIFQTPYNNFSWVSDYATYMELVNEACDNSGTNHPFSQASIDLWREKAKDPNGIAENGLPNYMVYPNTDWFDAMYGTGFSQEHNLSISGGGKGVRYVISGNYLDNAGIMPSIADMDASEQKFRFRVNLDADVTKWLTVGTKVYFQYERIGEANLSSSYDDLLHTSPGIYPGTYGKWGRIANNEDDDTARNILSAAYSRGGDSERWRVNATAFAKIKPYKDVTIEGSVNYTPYFRYDHYYDTQVTTWDYTTNTQFTSTSLDDATVTDYTGRNYYMSTEVMARYNHTFNLDHELAVLLGYTTTAYQSWSFQSRMQGATDWSLNDGSTYSNIYSTSYSSKSGWALRSYFARANYIFKDRYLFEANIRIDGSSVFGSNNRYGVFPSVSAGWKIHEEPWMSSASGWLSELKLRASWGQTGNNQGIGNYDWQATFASGGVVVDGSNATSLYISSMSNINLKWETTSSIDIGVDMGFFNNRLTAEVDYYYKNTRDILYTPSTYLTMGDFTQVPSNLGGLWNQGVEIALNWKDTVGKDFYYYVGANFSFNKNRVTSFKGKLVQGYVDGVWTSNFADVTESWSSPGLLVEGHAIGEHYIYKPYSGTGEGYTVGAVDVNAGPKDGLIRTEADMNWVRAMIASGYSFNGVTTISKDQLWYGDRIYADLNGDGNYGDSYDRYFTGHSSVPSYNLGITLGLAWKGLEFSMIWSGAFDYYLSWTSDRYNTTRTQAGFSISQRIADDHYFYDPSNPLDPRTNLYGSYERLHNSSYTNLVSDFNNYKADYMKLKNVTLAYTLPQKWTRKFVVERLKFYVSGENLLTITSYPGMDPEIGTAVATYPLMRQYTVGAQITF